MWVQQKQSVVIAMEPVVFWSWLVGLSLGLSVPLVGWAAKKVHEHALHDSRWQHVAKVWWSGRYVIGFSLASAYPLMMKWHFHADSIFSEYPPQFQWAELSYAIGAVIGVNWTMWRIKLRTRHRTVR